jgi:hypothetical protein
MVQRTHVTSDALGFRLSMTEAVVLSDATRKVAAHWEVDPVLCLGLTIAHEMGHLLLLDKALEIRDHAFGDVGLRVVGERRSLHFIPFLGERLLSR